VRTAKLAPLSAIEAKNSDFLKVTVTLPTTAGDAFSGKSSTINFNLTATQRPATAK
jgi:hypothetical protein